MADRANQSVLGVFVGIYVYCLLVLRTVRGGEDSFVPGISIVLALFFALVGVGVLIFFIHHIALSIQVSHIAARVAQETIASLRAVYPQHDEAGGPWKSNDADSLTWHVVSSKSSGYIQQVDTARLAQCAREARRVVRLAKPVGEFVLEGHTLLSVSGDAAPDAALSQKLRAAYAINTYRDISQDPAFGVQQLVDIALKALSPGVNDVGTARNAVNYLAAIISALGARRIEPQRFIRRDGELALIEHVRSFEHMLEEAIGPIRRNARGNPDMVVHLLETLGELARATETHAYRAAVLAQLDALREEIDASPLARADAELLAEASRRASEVKGE